MCFHDGEELLGALFIARAQSICAALGCSCSVGLIQLLK